MDINDMFNDSLAEDPMLLALCYENKTLGSFSTALMDLIGKADSNNRQRIAQAFPEYILAYRYWYNGDYKNHGELS